MSDQKKWFKLWTSILSDDDFNPDDHGLLRLGRFCLLGAYLALHGNKGVAVISEKLLLRYTQCDNIDTLRADFMHKNIVFEECKNRNGKITVTFHKWVKYQEDSTQAKRQQASRSKKRGEERRREEKRKEENNTPVVPLKRGCSYVNGFSEQAKEILTFLNEKANRNYQPVKANIDFIINRLKEGASVKQCRQVIAKKTREWLPDDKMNQFLRPATLFNKTKFAQYVGELVRIPGEDDNELS